MLETSQKKNIWRSYIDDIFFIWKHVEESLEVLIDQVNMFRVNFLDFNSFMMEAAII